MHRLIAASLALIALAAPAALAHRPPPDDDRGFGAPASFDELRPAEMSSRVAPRPSQPPPRRARLREALRERRRRHLAALHAYRVRGRFAHAGDQVGEAYVWIDADGRLDAVAAVMAADGNADADAVRRMAGVIDGARLIERGDDEIHDWMLGSGFSLDEIDRMQRPHTRPAVIATGDDAWKAEEDVRLRTAYAAVEAYLRAHEDDGLDAATDELMQQPDLAWMAVKGKRVTRGVRAMRARSIPEPARPVAR
jgi:hypothetical protein